MVRELKENEINKFIDFGDKLYSNDKSYVPFMRGDLKKTIKKLAFERNKYKALISVDENGDIQGRILLSVGKSKQLQSEHCGYFSHLEVINDIEVFKELMAKSEECVKEMGAEYLLGSFFRHDPDNRRGILVSGYEYAPMILTSHNLPYYQQFFEECGYDKLTDALEYEYEPDPDKLAKIEKAAAESLVNCNVHISNVDLKHVDREIEEIHKVMVDSSTKINFEEVPSLEAMKKIFNGWKSFINPDFAFIVRRNEDNSPVAFTLSIPDYNEIIRKMKGRMNPVSLWIYITQKNKIHGLRGVLQYVIPDYQHKGINKILYNETGKAMKKHNVTRLTLGTIMEDNAPSNKAVISAGGKLSRIYRLYYKELK